MKTNFLQRNWHIIGFFGLLISALFLGIIPQADVLAESGDFINPSDRPDGTSNQPFRDAVRNIVNYFLTFLGIIAVVFVIYAGVLMVTSGGDEEQTKKAKKILLYAGAGIIIILLSYAIVRLFVGAGDEATS